MPCNTAVQQVRLAAFETISEIYDTINEGDLFFTPEVAADLLRKTKHFLLYYNFLVQTSRASGANHYNFVPKFHYLYHLAFVTRYQNPKFTSAFGFENFMGLLQKVAESTTNGHAIGPSPQI